MRTKVYKFITLLKLPHCQVKVPYYHEPLIVSKRGCVNRSIEGDTSVRVGSTNLSYERITFDPFQGVWQSTQLGHFIQSSFGVMSLRANVSFSVTLYTCGFRVTFQ